MKRVSDILEEKVSAAMAIAAKQESCAAIVKPATDPKFGDYQVNGVMALAKKIKTNPRKLAEDVVKKLDVSDICQRPQIAGPGFINLRLKPEFIADALLEINADSENRLGIEKTTDPKTIVVDFSGPNIAKQMHVGHLRSTIIGDCICRLLEFLGHNVVRQNHIGDWGTALGKVILGLWHMCMDEKKHANNLYYSKELDELKAYTENKERLKTLCQKMRNRHEVDWEDDSLDKKGDGQRYFKPFLDELRERDKSEIWDKITILYQYVNLLEESIAPFHLKIPTRKKKKSFKEGEEPFEYISISYESLSRHITAMLQNIDDPDNEQEKKAWELITEISLRHCETIYDQLNVKITDKHFDYRVVRGESFYRGMLKDVVEELLKHKIAVKSDGAVCVFPEGFKNKEGQSLPFIIQKSDGAYLYATTDLAALRYRVDKLKADEIVYVTDARQKLHFEMLFEVGRMAGWVSENVKPSHIPFGSVLAEDGSPLKTRSGENVKLKDLLDEAVERAKAVVEEKNPGLHPDKKDEIANAVGIGAVKYADYSNNRTSDYIFSFDKMLAMEGDTGPYMQYAYARISSIMKKGKDRGIETQKEAVGVKTLSLTEPAELDLAKQLIRYGQAIQTAIADYRPNYLTNYLYELAQKFSAFYTNCPVLNAGPQKRPTRLVLCDLTAETIKHGLTRLLGIKVVEQM